MQSTCRSTHPTSNPIATYQRDSSRVLVINKIYAVDKKIDSITQVYSDSLHSANTTEESTINDLIDDNQHQKRAKSTYQKLSAFSSILLLLAIIL